MSCDGSPGAIHRALDPGPYKLRKPQDKGKPSWSALALKEDLLVALMDSKVSQNMVMLVSLFGKIVEKVGTGPFPGSPKEVARVLGRSYQVMIQDPISLTSFPFFRRQP